MLLSEAIRLGSMLHPQCQGSMWLPCNFQWMSTVLATHSCALGAAFDAIAVTLKANAKPITVLGQTFPILNQDTFCPVTTCDHSIIIASARSTIVHLNDYHGWTREAIADWVATLETLRETELCCSVKPSVSVP